MKGTYIGACMYFWRFVKSAPGVIAHVDELQVDVDADGDERHAPADQDVSLEKQYYKSIDILCILNTCDILLSFLKTKTCFVF
jgi:hypothetical protein